MKTCLFLVLVLTLSVSIVKGYQEFYKDVNVDGNQWHLKRYTTNCTVNITGTLKGYGISIRNSNIGGFAGVGVKESEHSRKGEIYIVEKVDLVANEGVVSADEDVTNKSYEINMIESWPTKLESIKLFSYRGTGITLSERFENNKDLVQSNLNAKKLVSLSAYSTTLLGMKLHANVTPNKTSESRIYNRTISYALKSRFENGIYRFRYCSCLDYRPDCIAIDESYYGNYTVTKSLRMDEKFEVGEQVNNSLNCP